MSEIFKALSDPTRIDILYYLHEGKTTKSLAQILVTSESTVSHHLNILKGRDCKQYQKW